MASFLSRKLGHIYNRPDQKAHPISDCYNKCTMKSMPLPSSNSQKASTIDWRSHPVQLSNPRPTSSVYSDDIMVCLISNVSEEIRKQEHQTIVSYLKENQAIEKELALYRREWNETIMLANEVIQAITVIKKSLVTLNTSLESAEKGWLVFWGIYKESEGSHPLWL
jgi:hypothetical protein